MSVLLTVRKRSQNAGHLENTGSIPLKLLPKLSKRSACPPLEESIVIPSVAFYRESFIFLYLEWM